MSNITLIKPKNPHDFQTRKIKKEYKFEKFIQMVVALPQSIRNNNMLVLNTIFEYMAELPKSSNWLLAKILSYRNYKTNITTVIGETAYEKEMIKLGYQRLFNDGVICRIQRGKYMVNPSIVAVGKGFEEDAFNNWNAHCCVNAVVKFSVEILGETMQLDGKRFTEYLHIEKLKTATNEGLKEFLELAKKFNWVDTNNVPTGRATSDEGLDRVLLECKARKLI